MASPNDLDLSTELRLIPALADVGKEALVDIVAAATQRRAHAGVALVEQGIASPHLVMLVRGAAKVVRTVASGSGESVIVLDVMRAPCIVGDASVLDGQPATSSVVTLRSSHVAMLDRRHMVRLMAAHPSIARALLSRVAQELRSRVRRIDEIVVGPVDERVKHLLDSLAQEHGTPLGQGRFIAIPLRRRDLANMVNATTETVSRLLAKFEREGLARSTRDGIWWRSPSPSPRERGERGGEREAGKEGSGKEKGRGSSLPPASASAPSTTSSSSAPAPAPAGGGDAHERSG
jgi:CRP-like cAMP-binding protein